MVICLPREKISIGRFRNARLRTPSRGFDWLRPAVVSWLACGMLCAFTVIPVRAADRWTGLASTVFRNYGRDQGIPHPVVTALAQGGDGFIWIGTQGGLARWDGYRFKAYATNQSIRGGLPDNWVQTLHFDTAGRLWIGTLSGHLARYDPAHDRFDTVALGSGAAQIHIGAIVDDGSGGLWIRTDDALRRLDARAKQVSILRGGMQGLPSGRIQAVLRDRKGALWVGTATGLARRDAGASVFVPVVLATNTLGVSALFEDDGGRLWIGTVRNGLFVINRRNDAPRRIGADADLLQTSISAIRTAGPHQIWAALRGSGILSIDTRLGLATVIQHDRTVPTSLAHDDVWALLRDKTGGMWVGGTGGLSYHPPNSGLITTIYGAQQRPGALSASDVMSILTTRDGHIWLGYMDGGIDVIDPRRGRIAALRPSRTQPDRSLPWETVFAMAEGDRGEVYIGTRRGLYVSTLAARTVRLLKLKGHDFDFAVNALLYDSGVLWIGSEFEGLWGVVPGQRAGTANGIVFAPSDAAKLTSLHVSVLARGVGQDLWVGTRDGLNRFDLSTHRVETLKPDPNDPRGLPAGFVAALQLDRAGRLWVGTVGGGLAVSAARDAQGRLRFRRFGLSEGLPHLNVDSLALDGRGTLWAGTDDGLARIDPHSLSIHAMKPADGAVLRDYFVGARATTSAGEVLFGAKDGFTIVRPGKALVSLSAPHRHHRSARGRSPGASRTLQRDRRACTTRPDTRSEQTDGRVLGARLHDSRTEPLCLPA